MKLASIEKILDVRKHPKADRLDIVKVLGYQLVTQKDLYQPGDYIIYVQPDTVLPIDDWTEGYRKYAPNRIRCIQLKGEYSEGILVPLDLVEHLTGTLKPEDHIGVEISHVIGVTKYEPPIPQDLTAERYSPLPQTDEERWENLIDKLPFGEVVDVTLKIDGSSTSGSYFLEEKLYTVSGRVLEFKVETTNNYTVLTEKFSLKEKLTKFCEENQESLSIRGEVYGKGIQSSINNPSSQEEKSFAVFSVYNIKEAKEMEKGSKYYFDNICKELELPTVPFIERDVVLTKELIQKYSVDLKELDGKLFEGGCNKTFNRVL